MTLGAVHGPNAPPPSLARTIAGLAGNRHMPFAVAVAKVVNAP